MKYVHLHRKNKQLGKTQTENVKAVKDRCRLIVSQKKLCNESNEKEEKSTLMF